MAEITGAGPGLEDLKLHKEWEKILHAREYKVLALDRYSTAAFGNLGFIYDQNTGNKLDRSHGETESCRNVRVHAVASTQSTLQGSQILDKIFFHDFSMTIS